METESRIPRKSTGGVSGFAVILMIAAAFVIGTFWNKIQNLEKQVASLTGDQVAVTAKDGNQPVVGNAGNAGAAVNPPAAAQPQLGSAGQVDPVTAEDHVRGNAKADLMLIEYSDIECPFCKRFHPTMEQVMTEYGDKVGWVYRHFPLAQLHPNAQKAAEATECVAELADNDTFWEYLDALMVAPTLSTDVFSTTAVKVGVNKASFDTCLSSGKHAAKVSAQTASGQKAGVTGTPGTVILNVKTGKTQLIPGAMEFAQIKQAVDGMMQ